VKILESDILVYIANLRALVMLTDIWALAYPPVDTDVRDYFLAAPSAEKEEECKAYLRAFMCSLFIEARGQIEEFAKDADSLKYEDLATKFYKFFSEKPKRDAFYATVLGGARSSGSTFSASTMKSLLNSLADDCNRVGILSDTICRVVGSLDEVHSLFEPRKVDVQSVHTLFSRFKSVLSELNDESFCVVFLSTAGSVCGLAPSKDVAPSIRERDDELLLTAPFTELPFDVDLISEPLKPSNETIDSVGSLQFTVQFGRPMYVSLDHDFTY
jgi:hypothetical protein